MREVGHGDLGLDTAFMYTTLELFRSIYHNREYGNGFDVW